MKHKFLHAIILICTYTGTFAQPVLVNQKAIGGTSGDLFVSMSLTKDGGLIAGGTSYSNKSFEKSQNIRGGGDYWVVKMDKHSKIQWDKTIGGTGVENFKSVIQTLDGGYAIIGESASYISVEKSESSRGDLDYWLVKLDSAGNIEWDKTIDGNSVEVIDHIVQTSDSGYVLAGSSVSDISGEKTESSRGNFDIWVVKLNKHGKKIWDKTIGGNDYDLSSGVAITTDGGVIIGGFSGSNKSGEKSEDNRGTQSDYWIIKLDKKGNIEWDKTIGGSVDDYCHSVYQTDDGGYILGGSSNSNLSGEKTENNLGGYDYWLVKIDKNGKKIWDKTLGSIQDDYFNTMIQTKEGGTLLGGGSNGYVSGNKTEDSRGGFDYWIVNTNSKGNYVWDKTIGGYYDEYIYGLAEPQKNKFVAGGFSYSPEGADKTAFNRGDIDFWIIGLEYINALNNLHQSNEEASIKNLNIPVNKKLFAYPNPAKDKVNVKVNGKAIISLSDQSGKIILTKTINGNDIINISNLPSGSYYLKNITTGDAETIIINR
jgi:hypothetical protein